MNVFNENAPSKKKPSQPQTGQQDERVKQTEDECGSQGHDGQDFNRENDLLDVAGLTSDRCRRSRNGFSKDIKGAEPAIQVERIRYAVAWRGPARLESLAEDEAEEAQHDERVEEYPQQTEIGTTVSMQHVALDKLAQQVAVVE